jgi:hypothetical protein
MTALLGSFSGSHLAMGFRTWFKQFKEYLHDTFMYFLIGECAQARGSAGF